VVSFTGTTPKSCYTTQFLRRHAGTCDYYFVFMFIGRGVCRHGPHKMSPKLTVNKKVFGSAKVSRKCIVGIGPI